MTGPRDVMVVLVVLVLSTAVAVLALGTADGVVHLGGPDYRTEFITGWWWLAFLLVPLPAAFARRRPVTAAAVTVALVVPHVVAAAVSVARYRTSGWGSGLEALAFAHPVLLALVTWGLMVAVRRRR